MMAPFRHADWSSGKSRPDTTLRLTDRGVYRTPVIALGQTLPSHSPLVRINVCFSPQTTKSRTSRE